METKVTRAILRWHGGKWKLAPWVISHFPPHRVYVEPYGGAASVLLRKPRAYAEVYNDLDGEVVNLFRVVRDEAQGAELRRLLDLTPFARAEFEAAYQPTEDLVERARRMVVKCAMGFGSNAHSAGANRTGFRANSNRSGTTPAQDWANYPGKMQAFMDRLKGVVIENRDAMEVMAQHDGPDTLHYVDPPYMHETRSMMKRKDKRGYSFEMDTLDHMALLNFLTTLKGMVVVSGYAHPTYDAALEGWMRVEKETHADGTRERTEVLWVNPAAARRQTQGGLML